MPKKIMILEDNLDMLDYLASLVNKIMPEAEVVKFHSMDGVYETAMNSCIDLFIIDIIIDTVVPGDTSGIRFVEKMRGVLKYEFTPVIFITSLQDPQLYAFHHLHCYSFIEKPINTDYVEEIITKALRFPGSNLSGTELFFRKDGLIINIKSSEILYIESINHQQYFHLTNERTEVIPYKTCRQILDEIGNGNFIQCSRNTIINRCYVESIDLVNRYIKLKGVKELVNIGITYRNKMEKEFCHAG